MKSAYWLAVACVGLALTACGSDDGGDDTTGAGGTAGQAGGAGQAGSGGTDANTAGTGGTSSGTGGTTSGTGGTTSGTGGTGGESNGCFADPDDPCGSCAAEHCCAQMQPCAQDSACQTDMVCLAMCDGTFDTCVQSCNTSGSDAFDAYTQCLGDNDCGELCVGVL